MKELLEIQQRLSVPKGQMNNHGNFKFRSLEDILEAVKPLLSELDCKMVLTDEVVNIGNHNYIKATTTLTNSEGKVEIGIGYAKEAEVQKGMGSAQITGSTSSYARKYSASGLLLIDGNVDPDANEFQKPKEKKAETTTKPKVDEYEEKIKTELGGRNLTAEATACKNNAELAVWYGNLSSEYKKEGSPAVAVKDARKAEIKVEQAEQEKKPDDGTAAAEALKHVQGNKEEVKEKQIDYSFEGLKPKTVAILKTIAKEMGVTGYSKIDKPKLITAIIEARLQQSLKSKRIKWDSQRIK